MKATFQRGSTRYFLKLSIIISKHHWNTFKKVSIRHPVICNVVWVNVPERLQASWENVQFFVDAFPGLMDGVPVDTLYEEFIL